MAQMMPNLINLDLSPLMRAIQVIQTDVSTLKDNIKSHSAIRLKDLDELEKYKKEQKQIHSQHQRSLSSNDDRVEKIENDLKKKDEILMQLQIDRDILNSFMKTQTDKNSQTNREFIMMNNKITEQEKQGQENLMVKIAEIKKQLAYQDQVIKLQFKEFEDQKFAEKIAQNFKAIEDLDLYVSEEREKFTKFVEEYETYKDEVQDQFDTIQANGVTANVPMMPPPSATPNAKLIAAQAQLNSLQLPQTPVEGVVQAPPIDYRLFVRRAIQEKEAQTKSELNTIVCEMIKAKQAEDQRILNEMDERPQSERLDTGKAQPFEFTHVPSYVEQIIEDHVRQLDNKLVYLEQVRPRFKHFELSSEIAQVFSHVEVQTFQQDQILKQGLEQDHRILTIQQEHEELMSFFKKTSQRLDQYDSAKTLDVEKIKQLEGQSELFRHVLTIFSDIKSDILSRCASKDFSKDLDARLQTLEKEALKSREESYKFVMEKIDETLEKFSTYSKQLEGLQLQIMKTETQNYDLSLKVDTFTDKIKAFERLDTMIGQVQNEGQNSEQSEGLASKLFAEMNATPMHVTNKIKEKLDELLVKFVSADQRIDFLKQKFDDHTKSIRLAEKEAKAATKETKDVKMLFETLKKQMKAKIDTTEVDEEIKFLQAQISALDTKGKANQMRGQNMRQIPKAPAGGSGGGGLSKEDKKKLDQATEGQEKLEESFRVLREQIHALGVEDLKKECKSIGDKADKKILQQFQMKMDAEINGLKSQLKSSNEKSQKLFENTNERINNLKDDVKKNTEELEKIDTELKDIQDQIANVRRVADQAQRKASMKPVQAQPVVQIQQIKEDDTGPKFDQSMLEEQNEELTSKFSLQMTKINAKIDDLKMEISRMKGSEKGKMKIASTADLKKIEDNLQHHIRSYEREQKFFSDTLTQLNEKFEEKIRRQALVKEKKLSPNASDEELFREMKKRPKFMAQHMTRELVLNGRLPQLENYGDHLARYGRGFSQMLGIASEQMTKMASPNVTSPRILEGFNIKDAVIQEHEMRNDTAVLGETVAMNQTVLESIQGSQEELIPNSGFKVTKRSGSIAPTHHGENPFAQTTTPGKGKKLGMRRNSNRTTIETKKKQIDESEKSEKKIRELHKSDSINLILPTIK